MAILSVRQPFLNQNHLDTNIGSFRFPNGIFANSLSPRKTKRKLQQQQQQQQLLVQQKHSTTILNNGFSLVLLGVVHLPRVSGSFLCVFLYSKENPIYTRK